MVHISQTCSYLSIYVYTRAYACVCVHLHLTSQSRARMTRICPCVDWGTTPADSVAGYWQLVTDTSNMNRYERDMCMSVSVQICYVQVRICSNLWRWYKQIQTDLNVFKRQKKFISGEGVYIMSIFVYISSISRLYTFKSCLNLFICLYSALLGVKFFLYKQNINKICTDVNDMNRYWPIYTSDAADDLTTVYIEDLGCMEKQ